MQVESFKVFRDLVESRSFSKAAALNLVTQSAVSQQIRAMEERFLVPLIERSNKRFGLTREGQMLYEASKQIVFQFDSLQHQLSEMRNVVSGTIRLSTVYSIGLHELPPYLKKFLREFPGVNVHVEYRRSNQVYDEVSEGTSDLGLVAFPVQKKTLKVEPFRKDRLVLICVPGHELAKSSELLVDKLKKEKFIGFEPDIPTRKAVDRIFREAGLEVNPVMEFDNIETVKRAVEIGAGVSIVPRATVEQEVRDGTLAAVEFHGQPYYRPLGIIYKAGRVLSPAMKRFLKTLKETLEPQPVAAGEGLVMNWVVLAILGVLLNGAGLCFFGDAVIHRAMANGAMAAGFLNGTLGLVLINAGICLVVEAARRRGR